MPYKMQPADVQAKFEEYRRQCDDNIETVRYRDKLVQVPRKIIYTLEGFCLFAGIGEDDLEKFEKNKNYRVIFKNIRYMVMCRKMHALVNGEGNTRGLIFDLKVNHGIDPKQAREETGWKVTLNLNHDNAESLQDGGKKNSEGAKPISPTEGKEAGATLDKAVIGERETGKQQQGQPAGTQSPAVVNNGFISLNKAPANAAPGPPKPEKMNPYSVW
ncbi:MAG TPA: terminase small subunit [Chitinophagaceae bacterium]|nr:terminase small subunit [Chitinophagaceae bacterium]